MRTLVVIPTYEEAANLPELLPRIRTAAPEVDVLIVDDNSPDGTAALAKSMSDELGQIDVLVRKEKAGLGSAYRAGFAVGIDRGYDVLVQMDADLSHDPAAIIPLVGALNDHVGMTIGSRYIPGGSIPHWPWYRRALSRYGNLYTRLALGLDARDLTSGYRAWKTTTLQEIDYDTTHATGYLFQMEMAYRVVQHGQRVAEVPITFTDRVRGYSKMSGAVIFEELTLVTWWGLRDRWKKLRGAVRSRSPSR
jgi:dolichol-phosphate mannosyltransferase